MADDLAIARPDEERPLPERRRQRLEAERGVETLPCAHHVIGAHAAALQDAREREAGVGGAWRHQVVHVGPVLRPDVAQQVRRERTVRRHGVAIPGPELRPNVRVELQVERPDLVPEPIELPRELVGRHVVLRPPHGASVREPEFARPLVREVHEATVVGAHRRRDRMPALPHAAKLGGVTGRRHDLGDRVDVLARVWLGWVGAPLAPPVGRPHLRVEQRHLLGFLRIGRRRQDERQLQQVELPAGVRRHVDRVEARRLLGRPGDEVRNLLGCTGVHGLRVGRDEVLRDPAGLRRGDTEPSGGLVDGFQKPAAIVGSGRRCRTLPGAARAGSHDEGQKHDERDSLFHRSPPHQKIS